MPSAPSGRAPSDAVLARGGADRHRPPLEVEAGGLGQHHADVLLPAEDRPQRIADLARGQGTRRDLVRERLEEVEVAAVDERDLDVRALEVKRGLEASEASAHDDDTVHDGGD